MATRLLTPASLMMQFGGAFDTILDLTGADDVLALAITSPWSGHVFLNPGYGANTRAAMTKMVNHGNGIALVGARPETVLFQRYVLAHADAVLFIEGRLALEHYGSRETATSSAAPSALAAYGQRAALSLRKTDIKGTFVWLNGGAPTRLGERTLA